MNLSTYNWGHYDSWTIKLLVNLIGVPADLFRRRKLPTESMHVSSRYGRVKNENAANFALLATYRCRNVDILISDTFFLKE